MHLQLHIIGSSSFYVLRCRSECAIARPKNQLVDWTGPYNLVLAQGTTSSTNGLQNSKVVDNYTLRYVQGPYTPFLRMDSECNLYDSLNFSENLGPIAINTTAQTQTTLLNGEDPYEEHLKTCAVGVS